MAKSPRKPRKSDRDKIAGHAKMLTNLLLYEASGGKIPLPKGIEGYVPPNIPFPERRALLDSISRLMITDMKVDPAEEESAFDILKGDYGKRGESGNGALPPAAQWQRGDGDPAVDFDSEDGNGADAE